VIVVLDDDFNKLLSKLDLDVPDLAKGETLTANQANILLDKVAPLTAKFIELEQSIGSVWN
jgi:hypothetical protein